MKTFVSSTLAVFVLLTARAAAPGDLPASPRLELSGLYAPVRMVRDTEGIPHIFAANDHDAYLALGYVQAADRFFQMDYRRRLFSGTLAELMGPSALDSDIQFRTLGLRRAAERSLEVYSPEARQLLETYSDGINAWLSRPDRQLPPEYALLELSEVSPWTPLDSLVIAKGIAFGLSFDLLEIGLTDDLLAYQEAGSEHGFDGTLLFFEDLFRVAPFDPAISVPESAVPGTVEPVDQGSFPGFPARLNHSRRLVQETRRKLESTPHLRSFLDREARREGSNFWVISGSLTESGFPILANDPHQALDAPSILHEVHLNVSNDPGGGRMNVWGMSFAGTPGVVLGCNERVCWGATVNPMDVTDVYEERLAASVATSLQIAGTVFEGEVEPVIAIRQTYRVNQLGNQIENDLVTTGVGPFEGGITYVVPRRNMGPIISVDSSNLFDLRGLSVQYAGWGATRDGEAILRFARVGNVQEFAKALQLFDFGSQNWACADVDGNIGYFTSGELPLREDLEEGKVEGVPPFLIRDGTHDARNEWLRAETRPPGQALDYEVLPFEEMPQAINPDRGFVVSGNNDPIGTTLDNNVLNQFRPGGGILYLNVGYTSLRAGRIEQRLQELMATGPLTFEAMKSIQADQVLLDAQVFLPFLLSAWTAAEDAGAESELRALADDPALAEAVDRLRAWNFSTPTGIAAGYDPGDDPEALPQPDSAEVDQSVAATLYAVWRSRLVANTVDSVLERFGLEGHAPDSERSLSALRHHLENFETSQGTGASGVGFFRVEEIEDPRTARDYILLKSLRDALDRLASDAFAPAFEGSQNQADYRWGRLHRIIFDHPLGGSFNIPEAGGFADLAPGLPGISRAGGYETVDAAGHSVRADSAGGFMFGSGPARRFVAEMNPLGITAEVIVPGGSGGDPGTPDYASQLGRWLTNRYRPVWLRTEEVLANRREEVVYEPARYRLMFPMSESDGTDFVGFAAANLGEQPANLSYSLYRSDGSPTAGEETILGPGEQSARLGSELFGAGTPIDQGGWIELSLDFEPGAPNAWPVVSGFFQVGDYALTRLDGGTGFGGAARRLILPRIYDGDGVFNGLAAETWVRIANPDDSDVEVELILRRAGAGADGAEIDRLARHVPAGGVLVSRVSELLSENVTDGVDAYLEIVVSEGLGVIAFQKTQIDGGRSLIGVNGIQAPGASRLYSAQWARVEGLTTSVRLINTDDASSRTLHLRAVPESGPEGDLRSDPLLLQPGEAVDLGLAEVFPTAAGPFVGSLVVEADGPGIVGDVLFGAPDGRFAADLVLQVQPFRKAVFGHVAHLADFYTGLALFNTGDETAEITVEGFDGGGSSTGVVSFELVAGGRMARTLTELMGESFQQTGGYLVVTSTQPLAGQELFGTFDQRLLSAVPPVVLE